MNKYGSEGIVFLIGGLNSLHNRVKRSLEVPEGDVLGINLVRFVDAAATLAAQRLFPFS